MRELNRNSKPAKRVSARVPAHTDDISDAQDAAPAGPGVVTPDLTIVHPSLQGDARHALPTDPPVTAFPVSECAEAVIAPHITSLPPGWTAVRRRSKVARDPSGVIRSLSPDGFDDGTRQAVSDFETALRRDYPAAGAAVLATIKAAARAYGMVTRLSAAIDRAGAVAGNGRLRTAVRALGEWEDRLAALLRSLPEPPTTPIDHQAALRAAVEAAKRP
jgi:hypothetical protein